MPGCGHFKGKGQEVLGEKGKKLPCEDFGVGTEGAGVSAGPVSRPEESRMCSLPARRSPPLALRNGIADDADQEGRSGKS